MKLSEPPVDHLYLCSQNLLEQMPVALLLIFIAMAHQGHVLRAAEPLQKT
jgi:hypothetical protein